MRKTKTKACIAFLTAVVLLSVCVPAGAFSDPWFNLIMHDEGDDVVLTGWVGDPPENIYVPNGVTVIGEKALFDIYQMHRIDLPVGLREIRAQGLANNGNIRQLFIPNTVTTLGDRALEWCTQLSYLSFSDSVTSAGEDVLNNCFSLTDIYFDGDREAWEALNLDLPNDDISIVGDGFSINANPWEHTAPQQQLTLATQPVVGVEPLNLTLSKDSGVENAEGQQIDILSGLIAPNQADKAVTVRSILGNLTSPTITEILRTRGALAEDDIVATGDRIVLRSENGDENVYEAQILVHGDVLGTGLMSIAQIVRMAEASNGVSPLTGIYLMAGDLNENGNIDIADITSASRLLES